MRKKASIVLTLVFVAGVAIQARANDSLTDMSLEDLLNTQVSVASKKKETISEAAGVISVITADDIKNQPWETLYDIIKAVPGVTVTESFFGCTDISFRGIKETNYNNRSLLLLNGHPISDVTVGTYWLEAIPANVVERIEIIRGPGSVIYGSGAFAGTMNVVTKGDANITEAMLRGGSKSSYNGFVTQGQKFDNISYFVGGSYNRTDGFKEPARDEAGRDAYIGGTSYRDDYLNAFTNFSVGGLKVDAFHFNQLHKDKFGITPNHPQTGNTASKLSGATLRYQQTLGAVDLMSKVYYSESKYNGHLNSFANQPYDQQYSGHKLGADVGGTMKLSDMWSFLGGAAYEYQKSDPYEFIESNTGQVSMNYSSFLNSYNTSDASLYGQAEFNPYERLKLIGGLRYNKNKDYGSTAVPRASVVYHALDSLYLKALYGSAYRNPTFFEKYVNTKNVLYGDPDLKPEKIDTYELASEFVQKSYMLRLAAFWVSTQNMIARSVSWASGTTPPVTLLENRGVSTTPTATTPGYGNTTGQDINGIELEAKGSAPYSLLYTVNLSYKQGKEKSTDADVQYLDKWVANANVIHTWDKLKNTLSANYVGPRKGNIGTTAGTGYTAGEAITVPGFILFNWKGSYDITQNINVAVTLMNIFKNSYSYPEYIRSRIASIPGDSSRSIFGQVSYKF